LRYRNRLRPHHAVLAFSFVKTLAEARHVTEKGRT
jgi:hypothetical protein